MTNKRIIILGAGISGLTYAYYLKKFQPQIDITILESSSRSGGVVFSEIVEDCVYEWGPRGVRPNGKGQLVLELVEELELWDELVFADDKAKKRYLYHDGKLQVLPYSVLSFLQSPYRTIFFKAFWRALRASKRKGDESVADFADRHFGAAFRSLFLDSLVSGVWAGDVEKMSVSATFPLLKKLEQKKGSLIKSFFTHKPELFDVKQYSKKVTSKALFSFKDGLQVLTNKLRDVLCDHIVYDVNMNQIQYSDEVKVSAGDSVYIADRLVSTIPSYQLSRFVSSDLAKVLNSIPYAPVAVLNFILPDSFLDFDGFGFLVPSQEKSVVLGMVANSNTFPNQGKSEKSVYTVMMGGARYSVDDLKSLDLQKEAHSFLQRVFGKHIPAEAEELMFIEKAIPQYELEHVAKVNDVELASPQNITILGNYMYGVSLIDIIAKSKDLAEQSVT